MIENLRQVITSRPQAQVSDGGSDDTIESVALAGVSAIQQLIAERDNLRNCVSAQQRDLVAMNAANDELRRRLGLIRQHYLELGRRILAQLEQFDRVTREAIEDNQATVSTPQEEANLIALAHRLKPNNGPAKSATGAMSL